MTDLRTAAKQALEALEKLVVGSEYEEAVEAERAMDALRAALAEPVQEPGDFDHGIGADRFKVVRGAFWWHVLIGDSPTEHGKFRSRASAEKMAADLLREFRNGAFVQHEAALAEPVQEPVEPVAYIHRQGRHWEVSERPLADDEKARGWTEEPLYTAPPQHKPLTEEEIRSMCKQTWVFETVMQWVRAIERAHGITP